MDKREGPAAVIDGASGQTSPQGDHPGRGERPQRARRRTDLAQTDVAQTDLARTSGATARYGLLWLRRRVDFQRISRGMRLHTPAFVLQCAPQDMGAPQDVGAPQDLCAPREIGGREAEGPARFGLTVSRRNGNAVRRNRIRRRLRAALVRATADEERMARNDAAGGLEPAAFAPRKGFDYVIVARPAAIDHPFAGLVEAVRTALRDVHKRRDRQARAAPAGTARSGGGVRPGESEAGHTQSGHPRSGQAQSGQAQSGKSGERSKARKPRTGTAARRKPA